MLLKVPKVTRTWQVSMHFWINSRLSSRQLISCTQFLINPSRIQIYVEFSCGHVQSKLARLSVHSLKCDRPVALHVSRGWFLYHQSKQMNWSPLLTFKDHNVDRLCCGVRRRTLALCSFQYDQRGIACFVVISKTSARSYGFVENPTGQQIRSTSIRRGAAGSCVRALELLNHHG